MTCAAKKSASHRSGPDTRFSHVLWQQYTVFDGLAGMQVEDILQGRDGFLWIATADGGLSRFDGVHFDNLTGADGLPHPTVMALAESGDGRLWCGTLGGGLAVYDGEAFQVYTIEDGLPADEILGLRGEPDGSLWVLTTGGVGRFRDGHCVETITQIQGKPTGYVYDMATDVTGVTWLATLELGVVNLDGERMESRDPAACQVLERPWKFAVDREGGLWIAAQYSGPGTYLGRYDPRPRHLEVVHAEVEAEDRAVEHGVRHLRVDKRGWLWATQRGALIFDGRTWQRLADASLDLAFSNTRLTYEDREGNIWLGLWGGGLVCCDPFSLQRYTEADGLPDREITSLVEDRDGRLWIGTRGGLAYREGGQIATVPTESGLADRMILSLAVDLQGDVWAGSDRGAIYRLDRERSEVVSSGEEPKVERPGEDLDGVSRLPAVVPLGEDQHVECLYVDRDGRLWAGTGQGWFGRIERERFLLVSDTLSSFKVMLADRDGGLWIGGYGFAFALQYYKEGELHPPPGCDIEPMHYVSALSEAADGTLWIGTGTGLLRYDKQTQTMRRFTREDGLSANAITALAGEGAADLWIGTSGGGVIRYVEGVFQPITLGQRPFENVVEAILRDRQGQLWLGTPAGLVAYQPGETPPGVTIRQVVADRTYREPKAVEYPETVAELRILYQGIRFKGDARQLGYRYRLCRSSGEGTWSAFARSTEAVYRNLAAGEYGFEVQARDRDGLCSEPARLSITISPDPHQERFQALAGSLHRARQPLLGDSASLQQVLKDILKVAPTDMTVLILGETGTGKGLAAQIIHEHSRRRQGPFISLNCGALPAGLVESELFGHEKGAFTGAIGRQIGHFELADGGTLFLDEIGDLPLESQRVLLHILEEQAVTRVGGHMRIPIDTRVIAATNRDLQEAIREGRFREDLFFRLSVFPLQLPPLRQRREDIPVLMYYFIDQFARHFNRSIPEIPAQIIRHLQAYDWPGNVRELEHLIQRALLVCGEQLRLEDLPVLANMEERPTGKEGEGRALSKRSRGPRALARG